jgi:hypothetical protein
MREERGERESSVQGQGQKLLANCPTWAFRTIHQLHFSVLDSSQAKCCLARLEMITASLHCPPCHPGCPGKEPACYFPIACDPEVTSFTQGAAFSLFPWSTVSGDHPRRTNIPEWQLCSTLVYALQHSPEQAPSFYCCVNVGKDSLHMPGSPEVIITVRQHFYNSSHKQRRKTLGFIETLK